MSRGAHLQEVVLQHVADDAVLVKVAAAALGAKGLAEDHLRLRAICCACIDDPHFGRPHVAHPWSTSYRACPENQFWKTAPAAARVP